jgi:8-oxo-dGTP pyrophosphatase MutT (NUDIX family)
MNDDIFSRLTKNLLVQKPHTGDLRLAAVSIIIRDKPSPSTLLIKRVERSGDPWSGQIAFPGGKKQPDDKTVKDTAVRETLEEVGIDLKSSAELLGYGGPSTTHTGSMNVVPLVFLLKREVEVKPNGEVASYRWIQLQKLLAPGSRTNYQLKYGRETVSMPAFAVGDYVVWGLTHRIISSIFLQD